MPAIDLHVEERMTNLSKNVAVLLRQGGANAAIKNEIKINDLNRSVAIGEITQLLNEYGISPTLTLDRPAFTSATILSLGITTAMMPLGWKLVETDDISKLYTAFVSERAAVEYDSLQEPNLSALYSEEQSTLGELKLKNSDIAGAGYIRLNFIQNATGADAIGRIMPDGILALDAMIKVIRDSVGADGVTPVYDAAAWSTLVTTAAGNVEFAKVLCKAIIKKNVDLALQRENGTLPKASPSDFNVRYMMLRMSTESCYEYSNATAAVPTTYIIPPTDIAMGASYNSVQPALVLSWFTEAKGSFYAPNDTPLDPVGFSMNSALISERTTRGVSITNNYLYYNAGGESIVDATVDKVIKKINVNSVNKEKDVVLNFTLDIALDNVSSFPSYTTSALNGLIAQFPGPVWTAVLCPTSTTSRFADMKKSMNTYWVPLQEVLYK